MGSIVVVKSELPKNFFVNTAYQMLIGGLALSLISLLIGDDWSLLSQMSVKVSMAMVYLILFGSIAAFTAFNYLLKHVDTEKVATSNYVNPVVAMFLGWFFLGEIITNQTMIAAIIMLTGVYFINSNKPALR
jgi:drug/metabolite transporter (DMT)-like permease